MTHKTKKIIKRTLIIMGTVFVCTIIVAGGYMYGLFNTAHRTAESTFAPLKTTQPEKETSRNLKAGKPFSMLILGVDSLDNDMRGRSDTIIVATVNKDRGLNMVSIPRDTYVEGTTINKINSAYADGGVENTMKHVNNLLDIKLDHYMVMNFEGLVQLVDHVGGITVNSPIAFTTSHTTKEQGNKDYTFKEGQNKLNGQQALAYSRERYNDPRGDYGRQVRQTQVITAVLEKLKSTNTLWKFNDVFNIIGDNMKTDLSWNSMTTLFSDYRGAFNNISQNGLKGNGQMINNLSYQVVDKTEIDRVQKIINSNLSN